MSYSFSVSAASKDAIKEAVATQFDAIVSSQPDHTNDRDAVVACTNAFVDALVDPTEDQEFHANIYGSLGWHYESNPREYVAASATINVSIRQRPTA